MRLAGILDHLEAVLGGEVSKPGRVTCPAPQVDRHDCLGPCGDFRGKVFVAEVGPGRTAVHEDWLRAQVTDRGDRHHHRDRGHQHFIPGAYPAGSQGAVQCGGAARDGHCVGHAEAPGELGLVAADLARRHWVRHPGDCRRERLGESGMRRGHGVPTRCRKRSKPINGHMFTQSSDIRAQSCGQVRRCMPNSSAA